MSNHLIYGIAIIWSLTLVLTYVIVKRPPKESIWAKVFQTNHDFDTTLGIILRGLVVFAVLAIVVIYFIMFHDDLEKNDIGMLGMHVIGMASQAIALVSVMNGHKKEGDKE